MDKNEKIKALKNYNSLIYRIEELTDLYVELFTSATKITASFSGLPTAHNNGSKLELITDKLVKTKEEIERITEMKVKIDLSLGTLKPKEENIIREIDINGKSLARYAKENKRNYKYIIRLHSQSLDKLFLD